GRRRPIRAGAPARGPRPACAAAVGAAAAAVGRLRRLRRRHSVLTKTRSAPCAPRTAGRATRRVRSPVSHPWARQRTGHRRGTMKDLIHYGDGVHAIDSGYGRPQLAAIHVIVQDGRAAVVDTASNASVPRILGALAALGVAPEAVDWVMLTHIHLDHAGGAGSLMCALPQATLLVHPRGLRHMIDPSKLWEATCAVYGPERAFDLYGQLVPVPAERIVPATDGLEIHVGSR